MLFTTCFTYTRKKLLIGNESPDPEYSRRRRRKENISRGKFLLTPDTGCRRFVFPLVSKLRRNSNTTGVQDLVVVVVFGKGGSSRQSGRRSKEQREFARGEMKRSHERAFNSLTLCTLQHIRADDRPTLVHKQNI